MPEQHHKLQKQDCVCVCVCVHAHTLQINTHVLILRGLFTTDKTAGNSWHMFWPFSYQRLVYALKVLDTPIFLLPGTRHNVFLTFLDLSIPMNNVLWNSSPILSALKSSFLIHFLPCLRAFTHQPSYRLIFSFFYLCVHFVFIHFPPGLAYWFIVVNLALKHFAQPSLRLNERH